MKEMNLLSLNACNNNLMAPGSKKNDDDDDYDIRSPMICSPMP